MKNLQIVGQLFIACALVAFGVQHFVLGSLVTRAFPSLPAWMPSAPALAYAAGLLLCATGLAVLAKFKARTFCLVLAAAIGAAFALFLLPSLLAEPRNPMLWTNSGKALVLAGACLLVAGSVSAGTGTGGKADACIATGTLSLSGFFVLAAIQHVMYAGFVATLIPDFIPGHLFWTYFAAVALIAGAIGMLVPRTAQLAARMSALMVFLWVLLLHIPRVLTIRDANETTALFEALAMCGMALLVAAHARAVAPVAQVERAPSRHAQG